MTDARLGWADLTLRPWRKYGHDRLYISADGRDLGHLDNRTGELHVLDEGLRDVLDELLSDHIAAAKAGASGGGVVHAAPKPVAGRGWQEGVARATRERGNTLSESALWHELEHRSPFAWERERVWGPYRLDFYCAAARLAVEVDGSSHSARRDRDAQRDAWFTSEGVETLRVDARDVERDAAAVVSRINRACIARAGQVALDRPVAVAPPPVTGWRRVVQRLSRAPRDVSAEPAATPYVGARMGRRFVCGGCRSDLAATYRSRRNPGRCRRCAGEDDHAGPIGQEATA